MKQKFLLAGVVSAALMMPQLANALVISGEGSRQDRARNGGIVRPILSSARDEAAANKPANTVKLAQSASENAHRVNEMQERIRRLNGQVEELTFQLLQLQEQMRKIQEDNEFRFQELEEKRSDASGAVSADGPRKLATTNGGDRRLGKSQPSEDKTTDRSSGGNVLSPTIEKASRILGTPPRNLGTLKFDASGNVIDSAVGKPMDLTKVLDRSVDVGGGNVSSIASEMAPAQLLALGRDHYDAGEYALAERALRGQIEAFPEDESRPETQYWLGRALFARGEFHAAATVFLDTHNSYPDATRAADTMLRLGLAMAGLNHREIACATYAEVLKQYPSAGEKIQSRVAAERDGARC